MLDDQKIEETAFSIAIRSAWRRPFDARILVSAAVAGLIFWLFWPTSLKVLGLAGPPVACFGILAAAVAAARAVLETRLYISDIGVNAEIRVFGFFKIRSWHIPRRQARQSFVRADFSKKTPTRSLQLLLADGSVLQLLHGLEQSAAKRLEEKTDTILRIQNTVVAGEDVPQKAWSEGIFAYPDPLDPKALLPTSAIFEIEKKAGEHLLIREKIFTSKRIAALAEFALLLAVSIFLNGVNPLFWLLTAWPMVSVLRKIGLPKRIELGYGGLIGSEKVFGFQYTELVSTLVAPDQTRGFLVSSYQVLLVYKNGERVNVWRNLPLEEAYFLEKQVKNWYKMGEESALELIQKIKMTG